MVDRLDLNLLVTFDAMMRERNVTRAAARLGIGQPATSAALNRLRTLFGDPLFVRVPQGMEPTARALEIAGPVADALDRLRATLARDRIFDPSTADRIFTVSGVDYIGVVALPALMAGLLRDAPGIDLRLRFIEKTNILAGLDSGDIDLAVAVLPDVPKHVASEPLITETFVCVTRPDHPASATGLTLDAYAQLPHVLVTQKNDASGVVDMALRAKGLSRRIALTVPQVATIPMLLAGSDMVATIGRRAAIRLAEAMPMRLYEPPLWLPSWQMDLIWSRRNSSDRGLTWLRGRFHEAVRALQV